MMKWRRLLFIFRVAVILIAVFWALDIVYWLFGGRGHELWLFDVI